MATIGVLLREIVTEVQRERIRGDEQLELVGRRRVQSEIGVQEAQITLTHQLKLRKVEHSDGTGLMICERLENLKKGRKEEQQRTCGQSVSPAASNVVNSFLCPHAHDVSLSRQPSRHVRAGGRRRLRSDPVSD